MVNLPWIGSNTDATDEGENEPAEHADAVAACEFQDGSVAVYDQEVVIERVSRSKFVDKTIPAEEISGIDYSEGITIGYVQIEQSGIEVDAGGLFSDPVNENTLHFGRGDRECARELRDAILERARG
ncbi:MAG: hypothetical protein ABEH88_05055 [Halobacteriales archaeon]